MDGPRIYNLFPPLVGSVAQWEKELPRIARMGFNWVFLNPFHEPGFSGSLYAVKDYYRLNPMFAGPEEDSDALLRRFIDMADACGLRIMMDLVVNHTSKDSVVLAEHPDWFRRNHRGEIESPGATDPDDPSKVTVWGDLAELEYAERPRRGEIVAYWEKTVSHYATLGFAGFRCDAAYKVPAEVWTAIIRAARAVDPGAVFFAETLGCRTEEIAGLAPAGFNFLFNSSKWWDFEAPWLLDQYEKFRHIAPSISFPESHDTPRLVEELAENGVTDLREVEAAYRQRYLFAALFSSGVMMPIGYEYGWRKRLDVVGTRPGDRETARFDLSSFIAEVNHMKAAEPVLNVEGQQIRLGRTPGGMVALQRRSAEPGQWVLSLINPNPSRAVTPPSDVDAEVTRLIAFAEEITPGLGPERKWAGGPIVLDPWEVRVFSTQRPGRASDGARSRFRSARRGGDASPLASRPIVIQNVYPELDCGRYPVKRVVGDLFEVWADVFREGHGRLRAVIKYRPPGIEAWSEVPMTLVEPGLDRWRGRFSLDRNGRYAYTIEAWPDVFQSWREEVEKKRKAGQPVAMELIEGRAIVAATLERADAASRGVLEAALRGFDAAEIEERTRLLLSEDLAELLARFPDRSRAVRYDHALEVYVDRERAVFAAWYEMFPRSQGRDPDRSATFADCERRLSEIAAMGFDVVYLPPIHPIGRINRKGQNNSLVADDKAPGSPYAIGSAEGGHTAVHPELGTLADFRRFVAAAEAKGMEIALDFAIQCAPDHPWIKEHPEWFIFRPDGTIKYAENPPKKYEDIVNVNFDSPHSGQLWRALRDVVLFWVDQGVRTFRVDNPHTKPVPFWEWLIREVQDLHPEVIFLSEAFTRPRVLEMLAKIGFTQSYTYFTWRNSKSELATYLTELTQTAVREYLRPNFFTNTPDILPPILQTGGRAAFQTRFVLAATLSGTYGIYNGFELCEGTAIPGTEEYLDSEKYQYKVWDWDRPGNIKDYITKVNAIRRQNPAFRANANLAFHESANDHVLFYSKATADRQNAVFVAVNLDPANRQRAELTLPLSAFGIEEQESFGIEELLIGKRQRWTGSRQFVDLDPQTNPVTIFRLDRGSGPASALAGV